MSWTIWRLKSGSGNDRRFKSGHPWAYSNELAESPKGLEPGAPVELQDSTGKFLARGYGNPNSLIAFRAVSRKEEDQEPLSAKGLLRSLISAGRLRQDLGLGEVSHRLCFGEADWLPGLVIDRYFFANSGQAFVIQAHTAGADRWVPLLPEVLKSYVESHQGPGAWGSTSIVLRNDVGVRKLEGLTEERARVLKQAPNQDLEAARIRVASAEAGAPTEFMVDLVGGQKTGFFLDQGANIQLAVQRLRQVRNPEHPKRIRILDLCCYVGQWSTQLTRAFRAAGLDVELTIVDASAPALALAKKNIEAQGGRCEVIQGDVLKDLEKLQERSFDIVISDPPAFIKGRKAIPTGAHAYLQLNTQVFRVVRRGGAVVSCSCSSLFEEEDFLKALSKAAYRNRASVRWVARGSQGPDHPVLAEFPEGRYLKCWIGFVAT